MESDPVFSVTAINVINASCIKSITTIIVLHNKLPIRYGFYGAKKLNPKVKQKFFSCKNKS